MHRGAGRAEALRLPYFGEQAADVLTGTKHVILISTQPPVTFFAYPDKPNWLTPEGCELHTLVERDGDIDGSLEALVDAVGAQATSINAVPHVRPDRPVGELTPETIGVSLAHHFPENAIVVDEGGTCGAGKCISNPHECASRLADAHRWLHWLWHAHGNRCRGSVSRPAGD